MKLVLSQRTTKCIKAVATAAHLNTRLTVRPLPKERSRLALLFSTSGKMATTDKGVFQMAALAKLFPNSPVYLAHTAHQHFLSLLHGIGASKEMARQLSTMQQKFGEYDIHSTKTFDDLSLAAKPLFILTPSIIMEEGKRSCQVYWHLLQNCDSQHVFYEANAKDMEYQIAALEALEKCGYDYVIYPGNLYYWKHFFLQSSSIKSLSVSFESL